MYYKKMLRELKSNKTRYAIVFLILAVGLMMVIGNVMASLNISDQMDDYFRQFDAESGELLTAAELPDDAKAELEENGVLLQEQFYMDCRQSDDAILRVYQDREDINKIKLMEGRLPEKASDVTVENSYADANDISLGDELDIGGGKLTVCGIGTVPDYVSVKMNTTDLNADSEDFGICFVTESTYHKIRNELAEEESQVYQYAYILQGNYTDDDVKDCVSDKGLITLTKQSENSRMTGYKADTETIMSVSVMMGAFLAVLFAFIIAVFIIHNINTESVAIGTLYALGVKKSAVLKQHMILPAVILLAGGVAGLLLGYMLCGASIANSGASYSYPVIEHNFYPVAVLYGIALPVALGVTVNLIVINLKLRRRPLELIRGDGRTNKTPRLKLKDKKFVSIYRIRQLTREKAIYILTLIGVFYAICIMMFSFTIYSALDNYASTCTDDVKWNYMYTVNRVNDDGNTEAEKAISRKVSSPNVYSGEDADLTVLGIGKDSEYFDFDIDCNDNEIIISDCAARKFAWSQGDSITLKNKSDSEEHVFKVAGIADYSASLLVFLPEDEMRDVYDLDEDYFNMLISDKELDEEDIGAVLGTVKKADIRKSADTLMDNMMLTVVVMLAASVLVFIAVLYLLLKQAIEKSSFGISVMQIFGYRQKEINSIFININFIIVAIALVCAVFLGKPVIDGMYPSLVTDIDLGFDTSFSAATYAVLIIVTAAVYLVSMLLLKRRLAKISYAQLLKNRE